MKFQSPPSDEGGPKIHQLSPPPVAALRKSWGPREKRRGRGRCSPSIPGWTAARGEAEADEPGLAVPRGTAPEFALRYFAGIWTVTIPVSMSGTWATTFPDGAMTDVGPYPT